MKAIIWNEEKNSWLKKNREISFEEILIKISEGDSILAKINHPNGEKYSNQKIYIIEINNYAYVVPFVENKEYIFIKTAFKSRKYKKIFLGDL